MKWFIRWAAVFGLLSIAAPALAGEWFSSGLYRHIRLARLFAVQAQDPPPAKKFFVFDGHLHGTSALYRRGGDLGDLDSDPQFSLPLAEKGGLGAAFFNTSVDEFYEVNHIAVKEVLGQIDHFYRQIALYPDRIGVATSGDQVRALQQQGKIAAILAIEGAIAIESDLAVLRMLHRLGLREMNLVHNLENNIGDVMHTSKNGGKGSGLTAYGRALVAEMNRLGILIDLSHAAEQTIWDVMEASKQPVVTTHSAARALVKAPANWSDEMIRALASKGGVLCVPFLPQQVSQEFQDKWHRGRARGSGLMGNEPLIYTGDITRIYDFIEERRRRGESQRGRTSQERRQDIPPLAALIAHIDHIAKLVGPDYVGISSDWGGYPINVQRIENAGEYQNIAQALLQKGYSEKDVAKITGGNMLRVFDQVVRTAAASQ
ncbi:MAG: membrane dipeptidase [Acidobacteria bacterium]|nr:membrane dipeptidase [Acidobacteriota bacterium]